MQKHGFESPPKKKAQEYSSLMAKKHTFLFIYLLRSMAFSL